MKKKTTSMRRNKFYTSNIRPMLGIGDFTYHLYVTKFSTFSKLEAKSEGKYDSQNPVSIDDALALATDFKHSPEGIITHCDEKRSYVNVHALNQMLANLDDQAALQLIRDNTIRNLERINDTERRATEMIIDGEVDSPEPSSEPSSTNFAERHPNTHGDSLTSESSSSTHVVATSATEANNPVSVANTSVTEAGASFPSPDTVDNPSDEGSTNDTRRFKQDSSDVVQSDFPPFEPFDD